jgi:RND family efflux transporter MFP subunit
MAKVAFCARLISLACLVPAMSGCGDDAPKQSEEVRPVRTVVVDPRPIEDDRHAVGEIKPRQESDLGFRIGGKLVSRLVDVGVTVKKGDLLARLDEQDPRNKLKSAEADVSAAQAVLVEAEASESRLKKLVETGATTRANYDAALRNLRSAEAKLESANAALALARDQLAYTELKADFDGIVTAVGAEPGQVVATGQMVVRLALPDQKDAVFAVAETAFRDKTPSDRPAIVVRLLSNPEVVAEGQVREVSPVADPATRTFQVKVTLNAPPPQMRFGSSVVGRLKTTTAAVVVLPGAALFEKSGKPAVWVVDRAAGTVSLRPISLARFESDRIVVSDGLVKGDIVVTAGVNRLREGQKVRTADAVATR